MVIYLVLAIVVSLICQMQISGNKTYFAKPSIPFFTESDLYAREISESLKNRNYGLAINLLDNPKYPLEDLPVDYWMNQIEKAKPINLVEIKQLGVLEGLLE